MRQFPWLEIGEAQRFGGVGSGASGEPAGGGFSPLLRDLSPWARRAGAGASSGSAASQIYKCGIEILAPSPAMEVASAKRPWAQGILASRGTRALDHSKDMEDAAEAMARALKRARSGADAPDSPGASDQLQALALASQHAAAAAPLPLLALLGPALQGGGPEAAGRVRDVLRAAAAQLAAEGAYAQSAALLQAAELPAVAAAAAAAMPAAPPAPAPPLQLPAALKQQPQRPQQPQSCGSPLSACTGGGAAAPRPPPPLNLPPGLSPESAAGLIMGYADKMLRAKGISDPALTQRLHDRLLLRARVAEQARQSAQSPRVAQAHAARQARAPQAAPAGAGGGGEAAADSPASSALTTGTCPGGGGGGGGGGAPEDEAAAAEQLLMLAEASAAAAAAAAGGAAAGGSEVLAPGPAADALAASGLPPPDRLALAALLARAAPAPPAAGDVPPAPAAPRGAALPHPLPQLAQGPAAPPAPVPTFFRRRLHNRPGLMRHKSRNMQDGGDAGSPPLQHAPPSPRAGSRGYDSFGPDAPPPLQLPGLPALEPLPPPPAPLAAPGALPRAAGAAGSGSSSTTLAAAAPPPPAAPPAGSPCPGAHAALMRVCKARLALQALLDDDRAFAAQHGGSFLPPGAAAGVAQAVLRLDTHLLQVVGGARANPLASAALAAAAAPPPGA
ncbi:MAG: hypothetical protein J3K34DRAFT_460739 [Monoraphidium minutum]|nr:MAG: hypothetical protein J3K34DRAFT_460739 [Monoraphidium minutum]